MLESVRIQRRQSEIRQSLAELAGAESLTDEQRSKIDDLDREYQDNERKYRAALIAEDTERRDAGAELETRQGREWSDLVAGFELRQAALHLDEGRAFTGQTLEVVQELRSAGGYRGVPVPWEALEVRAGETVSTATPNPVRTQTFIDRLFPASAAGRMGASFINIGVGEAEYPVTTQGASVGWAASETAAVGAPQAFQTSDKALKPDHTLGVQMRLTRKSLKQSGAALEAAVRRDMNSAMQAEMDRVIFLGSGSSGEPLGVITGASTYGINEQAIDGEVSYAAFRAAVTRFMIANAVSAPSQVRALIRPEVWNDLDSILAAAAGPIYEYERLTDALTPANVTMTANALAAPTGSPEASKALLTTTSNGVAPIFVGLWGSIDLVRDVYSDAASGGVRLTALATADATVARPVQLDVLTGLQRYTYAP